MFIEALFEATGYQRSNCVLYRMTKPKIENYAGKGFRPALYIKPTAQTTNRIQESSHTHVTGLVEVGIYIHIFERLWKLLLLSAWILMVLRQCYLITWEMLATLPNHPFCKRN